MTVREAAALEIEAEAIITALNAFPGTGRRFEKLADNLYTDYGHHPSEIAATLQLAHELNDRVVHFCPLKSYPKPIPHYRKAIVVNGLRLNIARVSSNT